VEYVLQARSAAWSDHPAAHAPGYRLLSFQLSASCEGERIGGNNVQAVVGAPDQPRRGLDESVAVWLASRWWVSLRNESADTPEIAIEILTAAEPALDRITDGLTAARGTRSEELSQRLFDTVFRSHGPALRR
jgi:hypothetical protein